MTGSKQCRGKIVVACATGLIAINAAMVTTLQGQAAMPSDWSAMTARIERASAQGTAVRMQEVRRDLLRLAAQPLPTVRASLIEYAIAYTAWRMAFLSRVPAQERDAMLDDAVDRLRTLIKADSKDIEARALLGGVYAAQLARSPMKAMFLGWRASGMLDDAATLDPENPRVALLQGINAFHTPAAFGGGLDRAEQLLQRSQALFAAGGEHRPWPNWGRVDAHAWLGQVLARNGNRNGARTEYDKALALAPDSGWVRDVLIPAIGDADTR